LSVARPALHLLTKPRSEILAGTWLSDLKAQASYRVLKAMAWRAE